MPGRGKNYHDGLGRGKGKVTLLPLRYRNKLKEACLRKPTIRRLARRAGVKRISALIYKEVNQKVKVFLKTLFKTAAEVTCHSRRKTITHNDIAFVLFKVINKRIYM